MELMFIEILGFVAGATNLVSTAPQLVANLRNQDLARTQSLSRNCLQSSANAMWFVYGVTVGSTAMTTFAGLGCVMAGCLAFQTYRAQCKGSADKKNPPVSKIGVVAA